MRKNLPNIIYIGKTIESKKIITFRNAQNIHSGKNEINTSDCRKTAFHINYNNISKNNNNISRQSKNNHYVDIE